MIVVSKVLVCNGVKIRSYPTQLAFYDASFIYLFHPQVQIILVQISNLINFVFIYSSFCGWMLYDKRIHVSSMQYLCI